MSASILIDLFVTLKSLQASYILHPLHAYLKTYRWFIALVIHLQAGHIKSWSPILKSL